MCQDEWLNESVIPSQISTRPLAQLRVREGASRNKNAIPPVTNILAYHPKI